MIGWRRLFQANPGPGESTGREDLKAENDRLSRRIEALEAARAAFRPVAPPFAPIQQVTGYPATSAFPHSTTCRQPQFEEPYYCYWTGRFEERPRYHRKQWEFVFIAQALYERGMLKPGMRGLGFGVGLEPLTALFASEGCEILATDMNHAEAADKGWVLTDEHAAEKAQLRRPGICEDDLFERNVSYATVDMNDIPADLGDFDFCWSACAFEHLGDLAAGLTFVENSLRCLKPGGYAVHTTEFNASSDLDTLAEGSTVLYRRRDMEDLARRLEAEGHFVGPMDFSPGRDFLDGYVDMPPYLDEPHLKLALEGFACTSFGLIVRKKP